MRASTEVVTPVRRLELLDNRAAQSIFGEQCANLRVVEGILGVKLNIRGGSLLISGADVGACEAAHSLFSQLYELSTGGYPLFPVDIGHAARLIKQDARADLKDFFLDTVFITARKRPIIPRTWHQKQYIDAIRNRDIVFGIGPAGTGKSYLAVAMAVSALIRKEVSRIILTRPAVEAGEKLGFLPGDLTEKINPYLQPLYDALNDMLSAEKAAKLMERGTIQVAPLAFMRGRTLSDCFVILDEAQNTTQQQMKMFLTRLGVNSKAVITGDITQIDLPQVRRSGLVQARRILASVKQIEFIQFSKEDVVRHHLVQHIIEAYERHDLARAAKEEDAP